VLKRGGPENSSDEWVLQELREFSTIFSQIPKDKDCKKCPYSQNGSGRGMVTPCFDICEGGFNPV
jgi:hypothetical protein